MNLLKKYKELILYVFIGGLTTLINIAVYYGFSRYITEDLLINTSVAWIASVTFAFVTNKLLVFNSKDKSLKELMKEVIFFYGFRLLSFAADLGFMYFMVETLKWGDLLAKIISNVIIILINYLFSKFIIFKKEDHHG